MARRIKCLPVSVRTWVWILRTCVRSIISILTVARGEAKKREATEVPRSVLLLSTEVNKRAGLKQCR